MDRRQFLMNSLAGLAAAGSAGARTVIARGPEPTTPKKKHRVAVIGCGVMGEYFAEAYRLMPDTELVAIAEWKPDRRKQVGEQFGVKALFKDVNSMLAEVVPDIATVATPTKFMKEAVVACAEAGVKGVMTEKPMAARLSDADEMVEACRRNSVVFAGGMLQSAKWEVQQAGKRLRDGEFGPLRGAAILGLDNTIVGSGCQAFSILRLFVDSEVSEVMAWAGPPKALARDHDWGLLVNGFFRFESGIECRVYSERCLYVGEKSQSGVDAWTDKGLMRWMWNAPEIFVGTDDKGARRKIDPKYPPFPWGDLFKRSKILDESFDYLVSSVRSLIQTIEGGGELWISGHDLRQALEIALACKLSALQGNQPVSLPLEDRTLTLYPAKHRWLGRQPD
jgi:predicted dehydrogenase